MKITLNKFMPLLVVAGFSLAGSSAALATDYTIKSAIGDKFSIHLYFWHVPTSFLIETPISFL